MNTAVALFFFFAGAPGASVPSIATIDLVAVVSPAMELVAAGSSGPIALAARVDTTIELTAATVL